jgi:hypothetical protein
MKRRHVGDTGNTTSGDQNVASKASYLLDGACRWEGIVGPNLRARLPE